MSGLELFGLALGVTGPIQQAHEAWVLCKSRYRNYKNNGREIVCAIRMFEKVLRQVQSLEAQLNSLDGFEQVLPVPNEISNFSSYKETLQQSGARLRYIQREHRQQRPVKRFLRATKTADKTAQEQRVVMEVEGEISCVKRTVFAVHIALKYQEMRASRGIGNPALMAILNVPPNPPWAVMDFTSVTESGTPVTMEGQAARALLAGINGKCSNSYHETVIEITGDFGIGKSCALRGIVQHEEIVRRYISCSSEDVDVNESAGGAHFLEFRADVTYREIIDSLATLVRKSGGWNIEKEIRAKEQLFDAVFLTYSWFKGKDCLFLIDDVFDSHPDWPDINGTLVNLSRCSSNSAVVFARRKRVHNNFGDHVHVVACPTSPMARRKLLCEAGLTEDDVRNPASAKLLDRLLGICNGKIIALAPVGNCLRVIRETFEISPAETLADYLDRFERALSSISDKSPVCHCDDVQTHHRIISVILEILEGRALVKGEPDHLGNVTTFFTSLCTLRRGGFVSYKWLCRYWSLASEAEVEDVCRYLQVVGRIGFNEKRVVNGVPMKGFRLRDRDIECCTFEAERRNQIQKWIARGLQCASAEVEICEL